MELKTPVKSTNVLKIPASPFMRKIGFGTGAAVYELVRSPIQNNFPSPWAVKKLLKRNNLKSNHLEDRLKTEAAVLRNLNHPNIVGFRGVAVDPTGSNILVMEYCTTSLGDLIEEKRDCCDEPYSASIILKVCYDIAKALDYLHNEVFLLHCDVKSYNILVIRNFDICKLCDFGVSLPLTKTGELDKEKAINVDYEGTTCWSPPEVLCEFPCITSKVDIYAFGLVIWEMIALQPPLIEDVSDQQDSYLSNDSFNEEEDEDIEPVRLRPVLPDKEFGADYNPILEIYYCCTMVERETRPSASALVTLLENLLEN